MDRMVTSIRIGERRIGEGQPCFIIAEAGVNHNGDVHLAKKLVDAAKASGADAVKFQTWITEKLVTHDAALAEYQRRNAGGESQFEMLKKLELSQDAFRAVKAYADRIGILFLSTPDEQDSADFIDSLGVPAFKIGSGEVTNLAYLSHIARKRKPVILSTGMSSLDEVRAAVDALCAAGTSELAVLHCVSNYPAAPAECNLRAMATLSAEFDCPVGFSDHTLGFEISLAAVALGASIIEKHFTLDRGSSGPDHQASLTPDELAEMVVAIRRVEQAMGDGVKRPSVSELETRKVVQKSVVAARAIASGEVISEKDLALRRTSLGLPPSELPRLAGHRARRAIAAGQALSWEILE